MHGYRCPRRPEASDPAGVRVMSSLKPTHTGARLEPGSSARAVYSLSSDPPLALLNDFSVKRQLLKN